jgi:hypothetical protein
MRTLLLVLVATASPLVCSGQDPDRTEVLAVALESLISAWSESDTRMTHDLVLDMRRTATGEEARGQVLAEIGRRIQARPGVLERYCVRIPGPAHGMAGSEVRDGVTVVSARILEWHGNSAIVERSAWHGSGGHTGASSEIRLERAAQGWEVVEVLTTTTGACTPASEEPRPDS